MAREIKRKKAARFERVDLNTETTHHFADHEVLMSFLDDVGAEAFNEWWSARNGGAQKFGEWCRDNFPEAIE